MLAPQLVRFASPSPVLPLLTAALLLSVVTTSPEARADVSSWLFVGDGLGYLSQQSQSYELKPSMQFDLGVGSPVSRAVVVGGLLRATPFLGKGTDLALAARAATQGFAVGDWGLALDAGAYKRWWGQGTQGFLSSLQLGAPYGITLSLNAAFGSDQDRTYSAFLGIDLLRLTVYRLGGQSWWYNPRPAWRPGE